MNNPIPQALPGFDGCEHDAPPKVEIPPFKYFEVEVTRTEGSTVYLKVPTGFDINKIKRGSGGDSILAKACNETLQEYDWDNDGWAHDIEWQSFKEVTEKEATAYEVYEVK